MPDDPQQAVFDLLADPATHAGAPVRRIDTHAASIFLAGDRALKVKRAVRFPYLDFSSAQKRKAACEAELEINRAFATELYRRVVPITREADGQLAIDGDGEAIEWAVEIARFDESQTLDHLAEAGRIDAALADALGRVVAQAHAAARPIADFGFAGVLGDILQQDQNELRNFPKLFASADIDKIAAAWRMTLARLRPLLLAREQEGCVRRCHGDLHLGNIVLIDNAPVLFDALEFDERIATVDLLHDLGFLLMDLIERDLTLAANIVLNRYLAETRRMSDLDSLAALPLFMSVRAAVRAKVTAERLKVAYDKEAAERSARAYFDLALRSIAPPPPQLIAIGGLSGTGKSQLARALAPTVAPLPGAVVLRSDIERKALFGAPETARLPSAAYETSVTTRVYASLVEKARRVVAARHSVIVDAVFAREDERAALETAAEGIAFTGLFLIADLPTRVARIGGRLADASDADAAVARAQESYDVGNLTWTNVDASGTPEETLARAQSAMRGKP